ncbi:hypothetical protein [Hyphomonas sp.]|uniref:hypothetical protein n=1 Tax=Hyphomonas sp. TaxID=87 RepID=UPI00391CA97E
MIRRIRQKYTAARPRPIGGEEVVRILSRGGMVQELRGTLYVFRGRDCRRMRIGRVQLAMMAQLEAEGAVRRDDTDAIRYLAGMSR